MVARSAPKASKAAAAALVTALPLVLNFPQPASAADAVAGASLARVWCANCHLLPGDPHAVVPQGPPSFKSIANDGQSAEELRTFLLHPHGAMPNLSLSRREIDDLLAYIRSLR